MDKKDGIIRMMSSGRSSRMPVWKMKNLLNPVVQGSCLVDLNVKNITDQEQ